MINIQSINKMPYIPPSMREKKSEKEISIETAAALIEQPDSHFPSLGASAFVRVRPSTGISFAEQALQWKKQREEIEMKERIQAELAIEAEQKRKRQAEEDDYTASKIGNRHIKEKTVETVMAVAAPVSEWTTVIKKSRKERKDRVNFDEVPEEMDYEEVGHISD
jgi:hypothetical protein